MIKDRGSKKWTPIMLPKHVAPLRQYSKERDKMGKPILDEQELEILDENIHLAMEESSNYEQ